MRKTPFAVGEYFHVYNRGVDKRPIFNDKKDLDRFFQSIVEFNSVEPIGSIFLNSIPKNKLRRPTSQLVEFVAYCLNHNHYHFVIKQLVVGGISEFMKRLGGGYAKYFNEKNNRSGALFQGRFKSIHIDSNEYLLHVSAYVNLNDRQHAKKNSQLTKSSWEEYGDNKNGSICKTDIVLNQFRNVGEYRKFALSTLEDILKKKELLKELDYEE
jgi:REP element-mobilizing transposase RayT